MGAGAATGGSLVAVSLLGQGLAASPTQQLTVSAVNRALAGDSKEPTGTPSAPAPRSSGHQAGAGAAPSTAPGAAPPTPRAGPSTAPGAVLGRKLFMSPGGSVMVGCGPSGAYLTSWSPQQGYEVENVVRGPTARASVTFMAGQSGVSMVISCAASTPSAVTSAVQGNDDSGEPGDN